MRVMKRVSALFLVLTMLCTMLPMSVFAADTSGFTATVTRLTGDGYKFTQDSDGTGHLRNWSVTVTGDGKFSGKMTPVVTGIPESQWGIRGGSAGFGWSLYDDDVTVDGKTAAEIQDYINNVMEGWISSSYFNGGGNIDNVYLTAITFNGTADVSTDIRLADGTTGVTATANGTAFTTTTGKVDMNAEATIVLTASSGTIFTGYKVTMNGTEVVNEALADPTGEAQTITLTVTGPVVVTPVVDQKETVNTTPEANRPAGKLAWQETLSGDVAYKTALGANYNAKVTSYLLDSNFGASIYYGDQSFKDPAVSNKMTFAGNSTTFGSEEPVSLGKLTTSGKSPAENVQLKVDVTRANIFPGEVTQKVLANYYTGGSICTNHWYHVYNVAYREDGLTRTFNILKDVISLYNGDGTASPVGTTYQFTGSDAGDPQIAISNPTLLPDSYGMEDTQVGEWTDADKANFAIYRVADAEGNELAAAEEIVGGDYNAAGTYQVRVKEAVAGNNYLSSYAAGATVQEFTVTRGTNPTQMEAIEVEIHADNLVVTGATNGAQEYSIDGGTTWVKPTDGKVVFPGLTEDTAYTIKTRIAQTDAWNEKTDAEKAPDVTVTTYIKVQGTVSVHADSAPMEKDVTVTFAQGDKTYPAVVSADGTTYTAEVPAGTHTVTAMGGDGTHDGLQMATASVTIADDDKNNPGTVDTVDNLELKDTDKGLAKKWMDKNLKDGDGYVNTVSSDTIDKILAADAQATTDGLTAGVRAEMSGELLGYKKADDSYGTFAEMVAAAKTQVTATGKEYYDVIGSIKDKTPEQLAELVSTKMDALAPLVEKWDTLSVAEKAEVDRLLGGSFEDVVMAEFNKQLTEATNAFVKDHLTEADGSITTAASDANYKNILAGGDEFFNTMNNTQRAAVNKKLPDGVTFEKLYADAYSKELLAKQGDLNNKALTDKQKTDISDAMAGAVGGAVTVLSDPNASFGDKKLAQAKLDAQMKVLDMIAAQYSAINSGATDGAEDALTAAVTKRLLDGAVAKLGAAKSIAEVEQLLTMSENMNKLIGDARKAVEDINNNPWLTDDQKADFVAEIEAKVAAVADADPATNLSDAMNDLVKQVKETGDEAAAQAFVNKNLSAKTDDDYSVYKAVTSQNADQILGSKAEHDALSDDQKALVDTIIKAANGSVATAPQSYKDFTDAVDDLIADTVADFIPKYVTDDAGKLITVVNAETYGKLMSGKSTWDALSKAEQKAIDDELLSQGGKAYSELIAAAAKMEETSNNFIAKYTSDKDGIIYPKATKENYGQILSGRSAWNAMSQEEKNAINAKLFAQAGTTYEELVKGALEMQSLYGPKTGDTANGALWAGLLLTSLTGLAVLIARKRKYN